MFNIKFYYVANTYFSFSYVRSWAWCERVWWPLFFCCLVPCGSGRITMSLFTCVGLSYTLTGLLALKHLSKQNLYNQYMVSLICTSGRENNKNCGEWNHRDVITPHPNPASFLRNGIHHFFPISGLSFFNQSFSQCVGMWKVHDKRKLTRLF